MEIARKPFRAIELGSEGNSLRVEEGFAVRLVIEETGEQFEGTVTKLEAKKITIVVENEVGDRGFEFTTVESIEVLQ